MFICVNQTRLFYEKRGKGSPLLLLHGNGEDHTLFDQAASALAADYTVYTLDSRGHGQSQKTPYLDYLQMAEDVAAFCKSLALEEPVIIGFSDGAILGLLLGIQYPDLPKALICCGANSQPSQLWPSLRLQMRWQYFCHPDPKLNLMLTQPDIREADLAKIEKPVLLLYGEKDVISPKSQQNIAGSIRGAKWQILPGEDHSSYILDYQVLLKACIPFLETLSN